MLFQYTIAMNERGCAFPDHVHSKYCAWNRSLKLRACSRLKDAFLGPKCYYLYTIMARGKNGQSQSVLYLECSLG